ncbi:hypothetical protein ACP70R_030328 [Stipagrostis hirtigluma subsp. patula]
MRNMLVTAALLLCLLNHGTFGWEDRDFFSYCPLSRCSDDGPEIRFPLRLDSGDATSPSCTGTTCSKLACSGQDTILHHPFLGPSKVTAVDYKHALMTIIPSVAEDRSSSSCPVQGLTPPPPAPAGDRCGLYLHDHGAIVGCSRELTPTGAALLRGLCDNCASAESFRTPGYREFPAADYIAGPIPCLSGPGQFTYLVHGDLSLLCLPLHCKAVSDRVIPVPSAPDMAPSTFKQRAEATLGSSSQITVSWSQRGDGGRSSITDDCGDCERRGRRCAFSSQRNQTFCMPHPNGPRVKVTAATSSVASFIVLSLIVATVIYLSLKSKYNKEINMKVEMFLQTYGASKPTRYTFSEVKKITRRFKEKVGQGGFGSVYKGQLPNGVPVAVKILETSRGEGEEFINEVSTIGRIHHANIVRLLGFCSEASRRALIYEFMPNESLEKYIFSCHLNDSQGLLIPKKLLDIALGVARGMEYLHQGCNQRILHFDIKPHNILLDNNFNPKISDFGLAKLCARDQSIVTLTAARGTMGYIAPELCSRNFGGISYKSDVYSFGMLVLEMVSGRRNSDPSIENQNEVYLPEWIYERVITGQDIAITREITQEDNETLRQLAIVALWCIQWNPKNRPSMEKVVNMLTGRLQNLQIPPKPFVSSESHPMP